MNMENEITEGVTYFFMISRLEVIYLSVIVFSILIIQAPYKNTKGSNKCEVFYRQTIRMIYPNNSYPVQQSTCKEESNMDGQPVQLPEFGLYEKNQHDYEDIVYPVPFSRLVSDISTHYENYGKKIESIPFVLTGDIPSYQYQTSDVLMMTGASNNHVLGSFNCLYSMVLADPYASYLYIDLGISERFINKLFAHFETVRQIQTKMHSTGFIGYRKFNFSSFPDWMNLYKNRGQRGGYTWKVIPYMDALFSWKAFTFWLDGGSVLRSGISREVSYARQEGIYGPPCGGTSGGWTFPGSVEFLLKHNFIDSFKPKWPSGCGGHLITDWSNKTVMNRIIIPYRQCAYTQKCISPRGSHMRNHRQDQAILSALINNLGLKRSLSYRYMAKAVFRMERGNIESRCTEILNNLFLSIQNTYMIGFQNKYYKTQGIKYSWIRLGESDRKADPDWHPI